MTNLTLSLVGEVIENLMGDSYHSLYRSDSRYRVTPADFTNKNRKTSHPLVLGKLFCKETLFTKENIRETRSAAEFVFSNLLIF